LRCASAPQPQVIKLKNHDVSFEDATAPATIAVSHS
jgi:hypothetical protein